MCITGGFSYFPRYENIRKCNSKFCNYTDVETILFLETEILDVPNLEKNNENERDRGTESRSVR